MSSLHCEQEDQDTDLQLTTNGKPVTNQEIYTLSQSSAGQLSPGVLTSFSSSSLADLMLTPNGSPRFSNPLNLTPHQLNNSNVVTHLMMTPKGCTTRRSRHFVPNERKDECYWRKRRKNNEAARKSREKRKTFDCVLEEKVFILSQENKLLREELHNIKVKYGEIGGTSGHTIAGSPIEAAYNEDFISSIAKLQHPCKPSDNTAEKTFAFLNGHSNAHSVDLDEVHISSVVPPPPLICPNTPPDVAHQGPTHPGAVQGLYCQQQQQRRYMDALQGSQFNEGHEATPAIDLSIKKPLHPPPLLHKEGYAANNQVLLAASVLASLNGNNNNSGAADAAEVAPPKEKSPVPSPESAGSAVVASDARSPAKNTLPYKLRFKYAKSNGESSPNVAVI